MDKKEKLFNTLNNHFNSHNEFPEIYQIAEEDIEKIISLYEQEASKGGKDPWNYLYFDELIIMQKCVYEVIKDNAKYSEITNKIEALYQRELNRRLQRTIYSYGVPTDETYTASYTEMPEYSLALAEMCSRWLQEENRFVDENQIKNVESVIATYEKIKSDFAKSGKQMPEAQEQIVSQAKVMIVQANEEKNAIAERERQQREIELINLQQEIIKMENEKLEIEKRIKEISRETLGSYFSKQVSEKYPEEYQRFQQHNDQVKNYSRNQTSISDIKARFNKISEELQLYKEALPVYESFYQRFEEMKRAHQQLANERQQSQLMNTSMSTDNVQISEPQDNKTVPQVEQAEYQNHDLNISNELIQKITQHLKNQNRNIYVKSIDIDRIYQDGKYIVVDAKDNFGHSIERKFTEEDFSKLFMQQSTELKQNETPQPVQETPQEGLQETTINEPTIKEVNVESIINQIKGQYPDVTMIEANGVFEYNGQYRANVVNSNGTRTSIPIDKESYDLLEGYFNNTPRNISLHISSTQTKKGDQPEQDQSMTPEKQELINDIISSMLDAGEFHDSELNISQKIDDIEYVKQNLSTKSVEELQEILSTYGPLEDEETYGGKTIA